MSKKQTQNAITKESVKGTLQLVMGWVLVVLFMPCSLGGFAIMKTAYEVWAVIFSIINVIVGIYIIISGTKKKKLIKTFKYYCCCFSADATKSIDLLAATTGLTVAMVTKNITDMINKGFFPNAYIDTNRNCLVFTNSQQPQQRCTNYSQPPVNSFSYITVQCRSCGATNKIISNSVAECEYCGSQISGKQMTR